MCVFFFQAEDGIRDLVRSRGLGDVYKRQAVNGERVTRRVQRRDTGVVTLEMQVGGRDVARQVLQLSLIHI